MVHSLSDMFWDKRTHHLKLSPSCQREAGRVHSRHCYFSDTQTEWGRSIISSVGRAKHLKRNGEKKTPSVSGDALCQEQQTRKDASPYAVWVISCNTWLSSHWLLLATALWIFTGSHLSSPLAPHTIPTARRLNTVPWVTVQSRNGKIGLSWEPDKVMRAGPVAITITNCSPVLSRQSQSSERGRPEVKLGTWGKSRYNTHFTQFRPALRQGSQLYAGPGWLEQWQLAGVLQFLTAVVRGSLGTVLALNRLSTSNT